MDWSQLKGNLKPVFFLKFWYWLFCLICPLLQFFKNKQHKYIGSLFLVYASMYLLPSHTYNKNCNLFFPLKLYCNTTILWVNIFNQFLIAVAVIQICTTIKKFNEVHNLKWVQVFLKIAAILYFHSDRYFYKGAYIEMLEIKILFWLFFRAISCNLKSYSDLIKNFHNLLKLKKKWKINSKISLSLQLSSSPLKKKKIRQNFVF